MNSTRLPEGRLGRLVRLAGLGARAGASALLSADGHEAAARHAAEVLGSLRGIAAKVGQMASYVDGVMPEEHHAAYEGALKVLRAAAPTSSPDDVRRVITEELGDTPERLFAQWNETPIASASIGQVHHATLHDGTEVAVKVQHRGIEHAVASDLDNAGSLETMISAVAPGGLQTKRTFQEIRERFLEELDYRLEADRTDAFAAIHAGDAKITVPRVLRDRSARRVITTTFLRGLSFEEAMARSEHERRAWSETLWRFVFKGTLVGKMFNADPHPGNYFFLDDGAVACIDFGCVQAIGDEQRARARAVHAAALERDEARFRDAAIVLLGTRPGLHQDRALAYVRQCFEPLFASPYRITRPYVAGLVRGMRDIGQAAMKRESNAVGLPPGMVFMNRLQFGFYSVLARLDVEVDYRRIESEFLQP
jgi:predicted unusual protein kinase regulating ubiquinone biosynthesis (AarF/ABC1/UbiB family)